MRIIKEWSFVIVVLCLACSAFAQPFRAGVAKTDITPEKPMPMWGYGDRHALLSVGVLDPLYAKCVVFDAGETRLAVVTMDIGRGPTERMLQAVRSAVQDGSAIDCVLISGSHTHHGPVIELLDEPGKGQGKYDDAVAYTRDLERKLIEVIKEAARRLEDAKIGWGSTHVDMNRNRQSKIEPKPRDTELSVVRVDKADGSPLAVLVNYQAHPTKLPGSDLRFSAEWPGKMMDAVESALGAQCMFVQGACGDLSIQTTPETDSIELYGKALAGEVLKVNESIITKAPESPSIVFRDEVFSYETRVDLTNPATIMLLKAAFFPEFVDAFMVELVDGKIHPRMTSALINNELFWVGVSGEFFCSHSTRLKERARGVRTVFQGYCNGHHLYFPTIEAAAEGGYGADERVSWVPIGTGEAMTDKALINLYEMKRKE